MSSMPAWPKRVADPRRDGLGIAEDPAEHVDVVDRVLDERAATGRRRHPCARSNRRDPGSGSTGRRATSSRAAGRSFPDATSSAARANTGAYRSTSPTWCGTRASSVATRSQSAYVGASGFSQKTARPASTAARLLRGGRRSTCTPTPRRPTRRAPRASRAASRGTARPHARRVRRRCRRCRSVPRRSTRPS